MHIAVEACIGAGKSSLLKVLEPEFHVRPEPVEQWTFLEDFYRDGERWAFTLNAQVLCSFIRQGEDDGLVIAERSADSCLRVFGALQLLTGNMREEEYALLARMAEALCLKAPDAVIYIDTPIDEAIRRTRARGRAADCGCDEGYLRSVDVQHSHLLSMYEKRGVPVLVLDGMQQPAAWVQPAKDFVRRLQAGERS